jgi:hypothetical protein
MNTNERANARLHHPLAVHGVRQCLGENERGWTARLTVDDEVVVYCPECDERELGQRA